MHISEKDISLYLDESLSSRKKEKLKRHLSVCKKCRKKLKDWECLYSFIGHLQFDFELDGLEEKIMHKIKAKEKIELRIRDRIPVSSLFFFSFIIFAVSIFFEPVSNILVRFSQYILRFAVDEGLQFINAIKWKAIDIIALFESMELAGSVACIILIIGGVYFTLNRKAVGKA